MKMNPTFDIHSTIQSRQVDLRTSHRLELVRIPSCRASKNIPWKVKFQCYSRVNKGLRWAYLKALDSDSGSEDVFDPLIVSTTGSPLSLADDMSLSLFDCKLFNCKLLSGISADDCGVNCSTSESLCISSDSSRSWEMLFCCIASMTGFLERGVMMLSWWMRKIIWMVSNEFTKLNVQMVSQMQETFKDASTWRILPYLHWLWHSLCRLCYWRHWISNALMMLLHFRLI